MEQQVHSSEWRLMECLWESSPQTLMQLVKAMAEQNGWAKSTVSTMVSRMQAKGLLRFEEGGKAKLIYPAISREQAAMSETESLIDKIFNGSASLLVSSLVENNRFTKQEIDELYELLRKAEKDES